MSAGTLWLARQEFRLAWRDWMGLMTRGRAKRQRIAIMVLFFFVCFMHLAAYFMVSRYAGMSGMPDKATLVTVTGSALLSWMLMLSQAMESVTRAFYSRADLELLLSSPVSTRRLFTLRIGAIAFSTSFTSMLLVGPFVNVLVLQGGAHWLSAYGVIASMGAAATGLAVMLTVALFKSFGPKRTRSIAQVIASIIGAIFVIGLQCAAILSSGSFSRLDFLRSHTIMEHAPEAGNILWWPARAAMGDMAMLINVCIIGCGILALAVLLFAPRFGEHAITAAGVGQGAGKRNAARAHFRALTPMQALRRKELALIRRDSWLISQTLMQLLYLLPPGLMLWKSYAEENGAALVLVPVLVMAAGQLAGGLAWLAISAEDAPELVATAPVRKSFVTLAKIEAVLICVAAVFVLFLMAFAIVSPFHALATGLGIVCAALSASAIQFWFRHQAKRSAFRRRQTSSRLATFAEAFTSIGWASSAALVVAESWVALVPLVFTFCVLLAARALSPRQLV